MEISRRLLLSGSLLLLLMTTVAGSHCASRAQLDEKLGEVKRLINQLFQFVFDRLGGKGYSSFGKGQPPPAQYPSNSLAQYPANSPAQYPMLGQPFPPPPFTKGYLFHGKKHVPHGKKGRFHHGHPPSLYGPTPALFSVRHNYGQLYYVGLVGKSCAGKSVYDLFTGPGHNDTLPSRRWCGCVSLTCGYQKDECSCEHYKSVLIDKWKQPLYRRNFLVKRVRVSVYTGGEEKAYFEFGPQYGQKDLAYNNFFTQPNLIDTSYTDLTSTTDPVNYFNIDGHYKRRFFINQRYAKNCKLDIGWHVVVDGKEQQDPCEWTSYDQYPVFLYALNNTVQTWVKDDVGQGDLFVISLQIVPRPKHYRDNTLPPHENVHWCKIGQYIPRDCAPH